MRFLARLFLGSGTLREDLRADLEAEGLVRLDEGLSGSVRYDHFRAPGKRFHGKVVPMRLALGISRERLVVYGGSGRAKLIDTPFADERTGMLDARAEGERVVLAVDYDRGDVPKVSGLVTIRLRSPDAETIVRELRAGLGR